MKRKESCLSNGLHAVISAHQSPSVTFRGPEIRADPTKKNKNDATYILILKRSR